MKEVNGVWLPDHEEHLYEYAKAGPYGEWTYQKNKLDLAMPWVRKRDVAVDVGGHCGIWARELCKLFKAVHSFEPVADHRDCYAKNQKEGTNWTLYPYALGEQDGRTCTKTKPGSSGDTWLVPGAAIEVKRLDWFDLNPDLLKIDTEGYELFVLKGGEATLRRSRPVVIVEQKPGHGARFGLEDTAAVTYLQTLGYKLRREIWGDYVMSCDV